MSVRFQIEHSQIWNDDFLAFYVNGKRQDYLFLTTTIINDYELTFSGSIVIHYNNNEIITLSIV